MFRLRPVLRTELFFIPLRFNPILSTLPFSTQSCFFKSIRSKNQYWVMFDPKLVSGNVLAQFWAAFGPVLGYLPSSGLFLIQHWVTDPVPGCFRFSIGLLTQFWVSSLGNWRVMSQNRLHTLCNKLVISPKPAKTDKIYVPTT